MKYSKIFVLTLSVIVLSLFAVSCNNNDDDDSVSKKEMLYDKWWYSIDSQGQGDHFFSSDGIIHILPPGPGDGTFYWGPNDSIHVEFENGLKYTFRLETIEEDYMEYWNTLEIYGYNYKFSTSGVKK